MIILYGVTEDGTSIPIEVTAEGKLVVDSPDISEYIKEGDDASLGNITASGTITASGKITGTDAGFSGQLDANGLTASPSGEGVISTRSSGGIRPVWRAGDGTFIKEDGSTYTSQITASGYAAFAGKVSSAATMTGDVDNTLATKGYVDANSGGQGGTSIGGRVDNDGNMLIGGDNFSCTVDASKDLKTISFTGFSPGLNYLLFIRVDDPNKGFVTTKYVDYFEVFSSVPQPFDFMVLTSGVSLRRQAAQKLKNMR